MQMLKEIGSKKKISLTRHHCEGQPQGSDERKLFRGDEINFKWKSDGTSPRPLHIQSHIPGNHPIIICP